MDALRLEMHAKHPPHVAVQHVPELGLQTLRVHVGHVRDGEDVEHVTVAPGGKEIKIFFCNGTILKLILKKRKKEGKKKERVEE